MPDGRIVALRHTLHAHPELSGHETETKKRLMEFIKEHTGLGILDRGAWFCAYKIPEADAGGPESAAGPACGETREAESRMPGLAGGIAFRADFDALPVPETIDLPYASQNEGVSHKCGHDGHAAALCGLALALSEAEVRVPVWLIFQPAEETGEGGEACAEILNEKGVRRVFAFHNRSGYPEGAVVVSSSLTQCASRGLTVRFTGRTSHASEPENGRNPAAALAEMVRAAEELAGTMRAAGEPAETMRTAEKMVTRELAAGHDRLILCTVVDLSLGRKDFGVSPGEGEISFTLRADRDEDLSALEEDIRRHAEALAKEGGFAVSFEVHDPFPETRNDPECAALVRAAARRNGFRVFDMETPWRASEDFGWYLKACPGAMFYIGNGEHYPALHTPEYDFNDRILDTAVRMFVTLLEETEP